MGQLNLVGRMDRSFSTRLSVLAAALVGVAVWAHARPVTTAADLPDFAAALPFRFGEWSGREAPALDPEVAAVLAADQYVHRIYGVRRTNYAERVEMDIAYYERPHAGAAMHSPLNCLPGNGWQIVESRSTPVRLADRTLTVRRLLVDRKGHRIAMTYWFQNRADVIASEWQQRLRQLTNGVRGVPTDAALVRVMALDTEDGRRALESFTPLLIEKLNRAFR